MAELPRFVFPLHEAEDTAPSAAIDCPARRKERPQISVPAWARDGKGYTLSVPDFGSRRPESSTIASTPPESPVRHRAYTMGVDVPPTMHNDGAMTPPPTPTRDSHLRSESSSSLKESLDGLRRGSSISSRRVSLVDRRNIPNQRNSISQNVIINDKNVPESTQPLLFPYWTTDYQIELDHKNKKKPLGHGAWSKVYRASPCLSKPENLTPSNMPFGADPTPPSTPVHSRNTSLSQTRIPHIPSAYAIKEPSGRTAQRVLAEECRILSHLSRFPDAEKHIVPFYGRDMRREALVLGLMDGTLEDWIEKELNTLSEARRATKLAEVFPTLAIQLLDGFQWLTDKHCAHGDLKPANILVSSASESTTSSSRLNAVFTDFSASTLSTDDPAKTPLGGATYDYLDPALMTKASATTLPSPTTDLWSLAITLLVVVVGASPYRGVAANDIMKREIIKQGDPLAWVRQGEYGVRNGERLAGLTRSLGWDAGAWFGKVLVKSLERRVGVEEWHGVLGRQVGRMEAKI